MGCSCYENGKYKRKIDEINGNKNKLNDTGIEVFDDNNFNKSSKKENFGIDEKTKKKSKKVGDSGKKEKNKSENKKKNKTLKNDINQNNNKIKHKSSKKEKLEKITEKEEIKKEEKEKKEKERIENEKMKKSRIDKEKIKKSENEKIEKKKMKNEKVAKERLEKLEKEKQEKLENERKEKEKLEKERNEKIRMEKERLEKIRMEKEKIEKERLEKERQEKIKLEKIRLEKERIEKEKAEIEKNEKEKLKNEKLEKERMEKILIENEKLEKEDMEKIRLENEKLEKECIQKIRAENEKLIKDEMEKLKLENEKLEKKRLENIRLETEKIEKERTDRERNETEKLENVRLEKIKLEKEKLEIERLEKIKLENEKLEKERLKKIKLENERLEKERLDREKIEKARLENEKIKNEKIEKERLRKEKTEKEKIKKEMLENMNKDIENKKKEYFELSKKFLEYQKIISEFVNNAKSKKNFCENFKSFIEEFVTDINDINSKMHISIINIVEKNSQNNNIKIYNDINNLYTKFNNFISILEKIEDEYLKSIENKYSIIQKSINQAKKLIDNSDKKLTKLLPDKNNNIKEKLDELQKIIVTLREDEISYEKLKTEIENGIKDLQNKGKIFCEEAEKKEIERKKRINEEVEIRQKNINDSEKYAKIGKMFLKSSMLLGIDDFSNPNDIFSSKILFKVSNNIINLYKESLLRRNWKETCYVYEDYDIYDINFELKAVGLEKNVYFNQTSIGLTLDTIINVLEFEIDGKKSPYNYSDSLIEFNIHLNNLESNQIHFKYKESKNLTTSKKKERTLYRTDWYGVSKNLKGQNAIFTLVIKCDYEIIGFEKGFLTKINNKENIYKWAGKVPDEGKRILVKMSRKTAKFNFNVVERIESLDKTPLKKTTLTINSYFIGGNNEISNMKTYSEQTKQIEYDSNNGKYVIKFIDTNSYYGEFIMKGILTNRCKGEWKCDLTNEQIEKEYPDDYKYNKECFKKIALDIIKNYDIKNGKESIKVTDFVKIGQWIYENIKYDYSFHGQNEISATEVYNNGAGVCHHFTKLYNALLYSLGYQCIYVSGYAIKKNDCFNDDNRHAWSLVKVNDKWLPFDSTWGIFSGKLPVCHVFEKYHSSSERSTNGTDSIKFEETKVNGKYVE